MTTSTTKHTAGPWWVNELRIEANHCKWPIALVKDIDEEETAANAQLIAAAPELLSALVDLLDACPVSCEDRRLNDAQRAAERIIHKVNGGN